MKGKTIFLLDDFNIGLLNNDQHSFTNEFLDSLSSHVFLPDNVEPTGIRNNFKTLIDNIYSNLITPNNISGNITATILDHLPQFLIAPDILPNPPSKKPDIFERDWSKFDQEKFILDYLSVDWENLIKSNYGNVNQSFDNFLTKFNWPQKSNKKHLPTKYIKLKDVTLKNEDRIKYK